MILLSAHEAQVGIRHGLILGFALVTAASAAAHARDFEMGGDNDFPYSIMAPERGPAPRHHRKAPVKKHHVKALLSPTLAKTPPHVNLSVVRGSSGSVLPTPLARTEPIPPEGSGRLTLPALPQEQGPSVVPGVANPIPNLPHGPETFQDRASRCAFQPGLYNVPGTARSQYMGGCVQ
ncbi:MAG: hypothetical protein WA199_05920 [Xanthobacteraceae bacterium]